VTVVIGLETEQEAGPWDRAEASFGAEPLGTLAVQQVDVVFAAEQPHEAVDLESAQVGMSAVKVSVYYVIPAAAVVE
jgi:hypothetical protein